MIYYIHICEASARAMAQAYVGLCPFGEGCCNPGAPGCRRLLAHQGDLHGKPHILDLDTVCCQPHGYDFLCCLCMCIKLKHRYLYPSRELCSDCLRLLSNDRDIQDRLKHRMKHLNEIEGPGSEFYRNLCPEDQVQFDARYRDTFAFKIEQSINNSHAIRVRREAARTVHKDRKATMKTMRQMCRGTHSTQRCENCTRYYKKCTAWKYSQKHNRWERISAICGIR